MAALAARGGKTHFPPPALQFREGGFGGTCNPLFGIEIQQEREGTREGGITCSDLFIRRLFSWLPRKGAFEVDWEEGSAKEGTVLCMHLCTVSIWLLYGNSRGDPLASLPGLQPFLHLGDGADIGSDLLGDGGQVAVLLFQLQQVMELCWRERGGREREQGYTFP